MSIRLRKYLTASIATVFMLSLLSPPVASASEVAAAATAVVKPATLATTQGSTMGAVASLRTQDQSGTADTPARYVLFQTPGKAYKGYRTYSVPSTISPGAISSISIKVNYKGPLKSGQTWSWTLYDWVSSTWVKVGDNASVTSSASWKVMQFSAPADVTRFINNTSRQIRLQLASNNALYDAKLDYEALTLGYETCADVLGCVLVMPDEPVHIAYLLTESIGGGTKGAQLAANAPGADILGHSIQFDGFDTGCNAGTAQTDAARLLKDASILGIVGTSCSMEAMTILPSVSAAGFSMVSPSNTKADLTDPGTPGYLRVSWSDNVQGETAAEYALEALSATKAATIDDGSWYSQGLTQAFASRFLEPGGTTITAQVTIDAGATDFRSTLEAIATDPDGAPDILYMPIFTPAAAYIINQARITTGLTTAYLMGSDGLFEPSLLLWTGSDLEGFLVTTGADAEQYDQTLYTAFVADYKAMFGPDAEPDLYAPYAYDAFNLIKAAIEVAAQDLGGGAHLIGRQALRDALYGTSALPGITGTLTCTTEGDCGNANMAVYRYEFGADTPTRIWPVVP